MKKGKILVTGGLGYIGSHTVANLLKKGEDIVIIDNLCNSEISVLFNIKKICSDANLYFKFVDMRYYEQIESVFQEYNITEVIHFAALKSVNESTQFPLLYHMNNTGSLMNLLKAMDTFGIQKLIFSSSCIVYGDKICPVSEEMDFSGDVSPYGNTKRTCENIILDCTKKQNLQAVVLRYFNPIGAHDSLFLGESIYQEPQNIVPRLIKVALNKDSYFIVNGTDYSTPDGTCIRDYIHVLDLAEAHSRSLSFLRNSNTFYEKINIGTGKGTSVMQLIELFEKTNSIKLNIEYGKRRTGDIEKIWAETTHMQNILKWFPEYDLENALKTAFLYAQK